jgi:hypothetical protein
MLQPAMNAMGSSDSFCYKELYESSLMNSLENFISNIRDAVRNIYELIAEHKKFFQYHFSDVMLEEPLYMHVALLAQKRGIPLGFLQPIYVS